MEGKSKHLFGSSVINFLCW